MKLQNMINEKQDIKDANKPKHIEILDTNNDYSFLGKDAIVYAYIVPDDIVLALDDENNRINNRHIDKFMSGCFDVNGYEFALGVFKPLLVGTEI